MLTSVLALLVSQREKFTIVLSNVDETVKYKILKIASLVIVALF